MDEKKRILQIIDKVETKLIEEFKPKVSRTNQSNPILRNLAKFNNAKIGEKWSIKDLLR